MTFTINKEYSKSTIKAPKNSAKTTPKLSKTLKQHDKHCCVIVLSNLGRSNTHYNASSTYLEQAFICRVDVQLIFKNARRNKKAYTS